MFNVKFNFWADSLPVVLVRNKSLESSYEYEPVRKVCGATHWQSCDDESGQKKLRPCNASDPEAQAMTVYDIPSDILVQKPPTCMADFKIDMTKTVTKEMLEKFAKWTDENGESGATLPGGDGGSGGGTGAQKQGTTAEAEAALAEAAADKAEAKARALRQELTAAEASARALRQEAVKARARAKAAVKAVEERAAGGKATSFWAHSDDVQVGADDY